MSEAVVGEARTAVNDALRVDRVGAIGRLVAGSKPQPANACDWRAWAAALDQWVADPNVYGALSCWRDPSPLRNLAATADLDALADLYRLIWTIDRFSKPNVALMDGPIGWAEFCLVRHGTHKVASERFLLSFAASEGGRLDCGASWWLARVPREFGPELALSGTTIDGADALALGLVTHRIEAAAFGSIEAAYEAAEPIDQVLDGLPALEGGGTLAPPRRDRSPAADPRRPLVSDLIHAAHSMTLKETLERDFAIAMTPGDPQFWPALLERAIAALALKPPAGVPEALG